MFSFRAVPVLVVAVIATAACSTTIDKAAPPPSSTTAASSPAAASTAKPPPGGSTADTAATATPATVVAGGDPLEGPIDVAEGPGVLTYAAAPAAGLIPVPVSGGGIPEMVSTRYIDGGGQLVDASSFADTFGLGALPAPSGPGAVLTDAEITVTVQTVGQTTRSDALGYLFVDTRPLSAILDAFAAKAGLGGDYTRFETPENGGNGTNCLKRTFTSTVNDGDASWIVSGCEYTSADLAGLRAVQVERDGTFLEAAPVLPAAAAPMRSQLDQVTAATGGVVSGWSYTFSPPKHGGDSTLTSAMTVTYPPVADLSTVDATLTAALPGYTGFQTGLNVTLANGALSWTADTTTATLRSAGRVTL